MCKIFHNYTGWWKFDERACTAFTLFVLQYTYVALHAQMFVLTLSLFTGTH